MFLLGELLLALCAREKWSPERVSESTEQKGKGTRKKKKEKHGTQKVQQTGNWVSTAVDCVREVVGTYDSQAVFQAAHLGERTA